MDSLKNSKKFAKDRITNLTKEFKDSVRKQISLATYAALGYELKNIEIEGDEGTDKSKTFPSSPADKQEITRLQSELTRLNDTIEKYQKEVANLKIENVELQSKTDQLQANFDSMSNLGQGVEAMGNSFALGQSGVKGDKTIASVIQTAGKAGTKPKDVSGWVSQGESTPLMQGGQVGISFESFHAGGQPTPAFANSDLNLSGSGELNAKIKQLSDDLKMSRKEAEESKRMSERDRKAIGDLETVIARLRADIEKHNGQQGEARKKQEELKLKLENAEMDLKRRDLESKSSTSIAASDSTSNLATLRKENDLLKSQIKTLNIKTDELKVSYESQIQKIKADFDRERKGLKDELVRIGQEHADHISTINFEFQEQRERIITDYSGKTNLAKQETQKMFKQLNETLNGVMGKINQGGSSNVHMDELVRVKVDAEKQLAFKKYESQIDDLLSQNFSLQNKLSIANNQNDAMRILVEEMKMAMAYRPRTHTGISMTLDIDDPSSPSNRSTILNKRVPGVREIGDSMMLQIELGGQARVRTNPPTPAGTIPVGEKNLFKKGMIATEGEFGTTSESGGRSRNVTAPFPTGVVYDLSAVKPPTQPNSSINSRLEKSQIMTNNGPADLNNFATGFNTSGSGNNLYGIPSVGNVIPSGPYAGWTGQYGKTVPKQAALINNLKKVRIFNHILKNIDSAHKTKSFYKIFAAHVIAVRTREEAGPRLKARLMEMLFNKYSDVSGVRKTFVKWAVLSNPNLIRNCITKVAICSKIRPHCVMWRLMKLCEKKIKDKASRERD